MPTIDEYNEAVRYQNQFAHKRFSSTREYPWLSNLSEIVPGSTAASVWEALVAAGVQVRLGGCGCCGSPWLIPESGDDLDAEEDVNFSTILSDMAWVAEE